MFLMHLGGKGCPLLVSYGLTSCPEKGTLHKTGRMEVQSNKKGKVSGKKCSSFTYAS